MLKQILLFMIRVYQLTLSALTGRQCRFYPTCSDYALQAVEHHGIVRGTSLSIRRICKCHPFHEGGVDLVPLNSEAEA